MMELIDTETNYVEDLRSLNVYQNHLTSVLSDEHASVLFQHRALLEMQEHFLEKMKSLAKEGRTPAQVAKATSDFLQNGIKPYSRYCGAVRPMKELISELEQSDPAFVIALAATRQLPTLEGKAPLRKLVELIMHPLQRVARYPMFLDRVRGATHSPTNRRMVSNAQNDARKMVCRVNLDMERYSRTYELHSKLRKQYDGSTQIRWLGKVLREDKVLYKTDTRHTKGTIGHTNTQMQQAVVFIFLNAIVVVQIKKAGKEMKLLGSIDLAQRTWHIENMLELRGRRSVALLGQEDDEILQRSWCIAVEHADGTQQDQHHFVSRSKDVKFAWENVICKTNWWKLSEKHLTLGNLLDRGVLGEVFEGKLVGVKSVCIKQWREPRTISGSRRRVRRQSTANALSVGAFGVAMGTDDLQSAACQAFIREAESMKLFGIHVNVLRIYGTCPHPGEPQCKFKRERWWRSLSFCGGCLPPSFPSAPPPPTHPNFLPPPLLPCGHVARLSDALSVASPRPGLHCPPTTTEVLLAIEGRLSRTDERESARADHRRFRLVCTDPAPEPRLARNVDSTERRPRPHKEVTEDLRFLRGESPSSSESESCQRSIFITFCLFRFSFGACE